MPTIFGTAHFVSLASARAYYARQGLTSDDVESKITHGEITIGKPPLTLGQRLLQIDDGMRYAIEEIELKSPTRADYMEGRCTHAEFYRAVAATAGLTAPFHLVARCRTSKDPHYNDVPLGAWDMAGMMIKRAITGALRQHGDYYSMAGSVCVLKQLVRDAIEADPEVSP